MKAVLALLCVVAAAQAGFLARAPQFDSAVIRSDRIGGNFAYSVAENHAYSHTVPVVSHVATPVAVSYSAPALSYAHYPYAYNYAPAIHHALPAAVPAATVVAV